MASLEQRGRRFRIVFRLGGQKNHAVVKSTDRREAEACLVRLEENLRLVERGRLVIPDGADVGLFLLSDGKLAQRVSVSPVQTLADLIGKYHATFTAGVKEKNTAKTERIHLAHVERVPASNTACRRSCTCSTTNPPTHRPGRNTALTQSTCRRSPVASR